MDNLLSATITEILEPMQERLAKSGKTYKAAKVEIEIETGETARVLSFNEVEIGEVVKVKRNGEYWNIDAPRKNQVNLQPVLDAIAELDKKVDKLLLLAPKGKDFAKSVATKLKEPDEVYDVPDDYDPSRD